MAYHNQHLSQDLPIHHFTHQSNSLRSILPDQLPSSPDPNSKPASDPHQHQHQHPLQTTPNWLNNALLRTHYTDNNNDNDNDVNNNDHTNVNGANGNSNSNFLNLHSTASDSAGQWLSRPILHRNHSEVIDDVAAVAVAGDSTVDGGHESADLKGEAVVGDGDGGVVNWQMGRCKAEILAHPLYEQLLSAHVACLRIATPVDQLPRIDAQLAQSQNVVAKYSAYGHGAQNIVGDDKELDQFMVYSYSPLFQPQISLPFICLFLNWLNILIISFSLVLNF